MYREMIALNSSLRPLDLVSALKAAAEPTRLRILMLLAASELSVKDLTVILGQSQPRISRHLKLLAEAGLVERFQDGSWAFFHVSERTDGGRLAHSLVAAVDMNDTATTRDRARAETLKAERSAAAQTYFQKSADHWDRIRALHIDEGDVEHEMRAALGQGPFNLLLDLGTGTGRSLELFAGLYKRGLGLDVSQAMLAYARNNLTASGLGNAEVRHGDLYQLALKDGAADAVIMHQVLHYLAEPHHALREAARVLAPGGKLLIVDFAPHDMESLRSEHAHVRLGFSRETIEGWMLDAGLSPKHNRDLQPKSDDRAQKLTVSLWLAERPAQVNPRATEAHTNDINALRRDTTALERIAR